MLQSEQQPWQSVEFFIREQFVEVSARNSSAAAVFDPDGRDRLIHCGMLLQRLRLTLKRHACFGRIDLFPDLDQPSLAARVYLGSGALRSDFEQQLCNAMEAENGLQRLQSPVADAFLDSLGRAASSERTWLEFAHGEGSRRRLMALVRSPARMGPGEIQVQGETATGSTHGRWKLSRLANGMLHERLARWRKPALTIKVRETSALEVFHSNGFEAPEGTYAVLKTKTDDKHGWMAVGQTLGGLMLHARTLSMPCTPFLHALRRSDLRAELRTAIGHKGFMQVILCFGEPRTEWLSGASQPYATMSSRPSGMSA